VRRKLGLGPSECANARAVLAKDHGNPVVFPGRLGGAGAPSDQGVDLSTNFLPYGPCGERANDVVMGTVEPSSAVGLTRVDPATGAERWRLPLGDSWRIGEGTGADGRLPRFLPLVVHGTQVDAGADVKELVVVDIDQGVIVSRTRIAEHMVPFVTADRAYVMAPFRQLVVAVDQATGALAEATRFAGTSGNDVRADDFRFGQLWLTGMSWARPSELSWTVIDLESARPRHIQGDIVAMDVTTTWQTPR